MKRAPALQPLSHQHHNSLMACLLISKGISKKANPDIISDFITRLYREDLQPHFEMEEKIVFPAIKNPAMKQLLQREHDTISILAQRITNVHDYALMGTFYKLLEEHVRFEERVVFNDVQENNGEDVLLKMEEGLKGSVARKCSDYPHKFWE
ncbi:MAG: hemerythrin domain-containing protein [Flavitalea sp.]